MSIFFSPMMFIKSLLPTASSILCSPLVLHYVLFCFRVFVVFSWADSAEGGVLYNMYAVSVHFVIVQIFVLFF